MLGANHARDRTTGAAGLNGFAAAAEPNTKPKAGPLPGGFAGPTTTGVQGLAPGVWKGRRPTGRPAQGREAAIWKLGLRPGPAGAFSARSGEPVLPGRRARRHGVEAGTVPTPTIFS